MLPCVNLDDVHVVSCPLLDFLDALQIIPGALAGVKLCKSDPVYVRHIVSPGSSLTIDAYQADESRHGCRE